MWLTQSAAQLSCIAAVPNSSTITLKPGVKNCLSTMFSRSSKQHLLTESFLMRISIGADHRGYNLKQHLVPWLQSKGYDVADEGSSSSDSVDYPDYALKVANKVSSGLTDRG